MILNQLCLLTQVLQVNILFRFGYEGDGKLVGRTFLTRSVEIMTDSHDYHVNIAYCEGVPDFQCSTNGISQN